MNWAEFEIESDTPEKHFEMKPCLRVLFFLNGKRADIERGVKFFYEKALSLIEPSQYHFKPFKARYDSQGYVKYAKNNKSAYKYVSEYLVGNVKGEGFGINFETTDSVYGISDKAFEIEHIESMNRLDHIGGPENTNQWLRRFLPLEAGLGK